MSRAVPSTAMEGCPLCGAGGVPLHEAVKDVLCGAPGLYDYRLCSDCELTWLSPMPSTAELSSLYAAYYGTVQLRPEFQPTGGLKASVRAAVLKAWHSYEPHTRPRWVLPGWVGQVLGSIPAVRRRSEYGLGLLLPPRRVGNRLLDVGCGLGWYMKTLREWGWECVGIEEDEQVARAGREEMGQNILTGSLESQGLPTGAFDAVVLRHVIEHLPDPLSTLMECCRVLKPGGWLGIATPNGRSLCSRWFGRHWRGLVPPWHVALFGPGTLRRALIDTGFRVTRLRTTAVSAGWIFTTSRLIQGGVYDPSKIATSSRLFYVIEGLVNAVVGGLGEELEATAERLTGPTR